MNKSRIVLAVGFVVAAAIVGGAWAMGWFGGSSPELDEIMSLIADGPPDKQRGEAIRQAVDKQTAGMTDDQKGEFFREKMMPLFMATMAKRFSEEYDKLMAMSVEDRNRELDRRIDEMTKNRPRDGRACEQTTARAGAVAGTDECIQGQMLDVISPDQRSKMENGMKLLQQRMKERGMAPPPGPGGGFF